MLCKSIINVAWEGFLPEGSSGRHVDTASFRRPKSPISHLSSDMGFGQVPEAQQWASQVLGTPGPGKNVEEAWVSDCVWVSECVRCVFRCLVRVCARLRRATIPGESNSLPAHPRCQVRTLRYMQTSQDPRSRLLEDPTRGTWPEAGNEEQSQLVEHSPSLTLSRATRYHGVGC